MSAHASTPYSSCSDAPAHPIGLLHTLSHWAAQLARSTWTPAPAARSTGAGPRPRSKLRPPFRTPDVSSELDPQTARDLGLGDDTAHRRKLFRTAERARHGLSF